MKKNAKQVFALALTFSIVASLAGCGGDDVQVVAAPTHEKETYYTFSFDRFGSNVMPIGGYIGPLGEYAHQGNYIPSTVTNEQYETANECGLNFFAAMKQDYNTKPEETMLALDYAANNEMVLFIQDTGLFNLHGSDLKPPVGLEEFTARVEAYRHHIGFAGLVGRDEPFGFELNECAAVQQRFDEVFTEGSYGLYMNSHGVQAPQSWLAGGPNGIMEDFWTEEEKTQMWTVEQFNRKYIEALEGAKFYSYDVYPFVNGSVRGGYLENLQLVRDLTIEYGLPFWAFIQSGGYYDNQDNWDTPTEWQMYWNVNTSLAYGAKGIQYFPYNHPPEFNASESGVPSLIGRYGEKTDRWYYAQNANMQIKAIDHILMNAAHMGIMANGASPCALEPTLTKFREVVSLKGDDSLVGCFDYNGKTVLYVVNNSFTKDKAQVTLGFNNAYAFEVTQRAQTTTVSGQTLTLTLGAGQGALVVLK